MREELEALKDHPDPRPELDEVRLRRGDHHAVDDDRSAVDGLEPIDAANEGTLPGPTRPTHDDDRPFRDRRRASVERAKLAVPFRDVADLDHPARVVRRV